MLRLATLLSILRRYKWSIRWHCVWPIKFQINPTSRSIIVHHLLLKLESLKHLLLKLEFIEFKNCFTSCAIKFLVWSSCFRESIATTLFPLSIATLFANSISIFLQYLLKNCWKKQNLCPKTKNPNGKTSLKIQKNENPDKIKLKVFNFLKILSFSTKKWKTQIRLS